MADDTSDKPKASAPIHVRKAWDGKLTVAEAWSQGLDPRAACGGCGARGPGKMAVWIRTYYPLADFLRVYGPRQAVLHARKYGGKLPEYPTIHGMMIFISELYACRGCAPAAEAAAAQHPSWALVEVRKAPRERVLVQVPRGATI